MKQLTKREIDEMQKEILFPTFFDKYRTVKIKDLTVHDKYNQILQVALKTNNNQKKIQSLTKSIDMQKSLQKLLKYGFNATNMEVDDVHLNRRMEENRCEGEIRDFLQKNPSVIDEFIKQIYSKSIELTKENLQKYFGEQSESESESEDDQKQKTGPEIIINSQPLQTPPKMQESMLYRSPTKLGASLSRRNTFLDKFSSQKRNSAAVSSQWVLMDSPQKLNIISQARRSAVVGADSIPVPNLDKYSVQNHDSKCSEVSYRGPPTPPPPVKPVIRYSPIPQPPEPPTRRLSKLDSILKRSSFIKLQLQKQQDEEKRLQEEKERLEEEERQRKAKEEEEKKAQLVRYNSEPNIQEFMAKRKFLSQKEPKVIKNLNNNDFVLNRVKQKFSRVQTSQKSINQIVLEAVKKEENRLSRQKKKQQEDYIKNSKFIMDKLDFTKNFCEPILEERELEPNDSNPKSTMKVHRAPRGVLNIATSDIVGLIPSIDREYAASPEFIQKQSALFREQALFRKTNSKDLLSTQVQTDFEKQEMFKSLDQSYSTPKKNSPYLQPFKQIFADVKNLGKLTPVAQAENIELFSPFYHQRSGFGKIKDKNKDIQSLISPNTDPKDKKFKTQIGFKTKPLIKKGTLINKMGATERIKQMDKIKGLTNIIWSCSNLIDQNEKDKKRLFSVEKYTHQEFRDLSEKYLTIHGVNELLSGL